jgi:hypothetical protein
MGSAMRAAGVGGGFWVREQLGLVLFPWNSQLVARAGDDLRGPNALMNRPALPSRLHAQLCRNESSTGCCPDREICSEYV